MEHLRRIEQFLLHRPLLSAIVGAVLNTAFPIASQFLQVDGGAMIVMGIFSGIGIAIMVLVVIFIWKRADLYLTKIELIKAKGSLGDELRDAKQIWAIWHTGELIWLKGELSGNNKLNLSKLIITDYRANGQANPLLEYMEPRRELKDKGKITEHHVDIIKNVAKAVMESGGKVYFYPGPINDSIVIADNENLEDGFSKSAWVRIETGTPLVDSNNRISVVIKNNKNRKEFNNFVNHFTEVLKRSREATKEELSLTVN